MPAGVPRYIRAYDNGGASAGGSIDRYTVIFTGRAARQGGPDTRSQWPYLAMNAAPFHPQGFGQHGFSWDRPADVRGSSWGGAPMGRKCHLGTRIEFATLPEDCRRLVVDDYCATWGLPLPASHFSTMARAYLVAALWTEDDDAGSGDFEANGRPETLWHLWAPESLTTAAQTCREFLHKHRQDIESAGLSEDQAGHDLWLTRNGHGSGFWDREGDKPTLTRLTDAAHALGGADLYQGDDGKLYFSR